MAQPKKVQNFLIVGHFHGHAFAQFEWGSSQPAAISQPYEYGGPAASGETPFALSAMLSLSSRYSSYIAQGATNPQPSHPLGLDPLPPSARSLQMAVSRG